MKRFSLCGLCVLLCACLLCSCTATPSVTSDPSTPTTKPTTTTTTRPTDIKPFVHFPGFDADTVVLSVAFPADFPTELYVAEPLTDLDAFEWGQYVPFVQCNGQGYTRHMYYYDAGFITSSCTSLRDACLLYDKLNDLYLTESEIIDVIGDGSYSQPVTQAPYTILGRPMFVDMLFRSHIVSLSPDLSRIGKMTFLFQGDEQTAFLDKAEWWQDQYDIYQDGVLVQSDRMDQKGLEDYFSYYNYGSYFETRQSGLGKTVPSYVQADGENHVLATANEQLAIYRKYPNHYGVYSVEDMKLLYEITFEDERSEAGSRTMEIEQVVQDRYLLLSVSQGTNDPFTYFDCAYLYDLKTGTMTFLEDHVYYPSLSPDGKYLAYTAPLEADLGIQNDQEIPMEQGFYIKNLQNDTTVFFADTRGYIAGWVDEQILMQKIGM